MRARPRLVFFLPLLAAVVVASGGCPAPEEPEKGCLSCHEGIEQAHGPIAADDCVTCHGGDPNASTKAGAHIPVPENWAAIRGDGLPPAPHGFIRDFAPDQLDALDSDYVRFINPGDIRVVDQTCGICHPSQASTMGNSIMTTNAGHYYPTLHLVGVQEDTLARYGSYLAGDPDCDPDGIPGSVCQLTTLTPATAPEISDVIAGGSLADVEELAYGHYLAKNCNTCHSAGFPRNNSAALFRSTGCTGCHMVYNEFGTYEGGDPTLARGTPVHPNRHEITKQIPSEQCATCHFQGGRIGLLFRGIREGGFGEAFTPPNATPIQKTLYGHAPGYYFTDEDDTNEIDETPPDLHYEAGMHCADCHVGSDVHGDGRIYSSSKLQVSLRCEDCHGTIDQRAQPDGNGDFYTQTGRLLPQLSQRGDGSVVLTGIVDGAEHVVTQPADLLADGGGGSAAMHEAMARVDGWSHTDDLTCDTCHTSYNQQCIGCHVSYDLRLDSIDYQTGTVTPGLTRGGRSAYSLDTVLLGTAPDGRAQTVLASQQVQMAVIGSEQFGTGEGEVLLGEDQGDGKVVGEFRHRDGLEANNGFVPFFQHTTTRTPRTCDTCHRREDTPEETARVRGVYGYGTGEFMLDAPGGEQIDGLQFLADDGTPLTTWVHPGTGPLAQERIQRALDVILDAP